MVAFCLNCLICGCGWGSNVITNTELMKQYFAYEDIYSEFPENQITDAVYKGKISEEIGDKLLKSYKKLSSMDWMYNIIALQPGKIIDVILEMDDWYEVYDKDGQKYYFYDSDLNRDNYDKKAYIIHKNCYKLLKKNGYDVSYEAFKNVDNIQPIGRIKLTKPNISNNKFNINYGVASKYIGEYGVFYEYAAYLFDPYLLENPLKNKKNTDRILKLKFPLPKINSRSKSPNKSNSLKTRKGPIESATLFKIGTKKKGNDGNMWIISVNKNNVKRWVLYKKGSRDSTRKGSRGSTRKGSIKRSRKGSRKGSRK